MEIEMQDTIILTKLSSKGQVEIHAHEYCYKPTMYARLDGKLIGSSGSYIDKQAGLPLDCTHICCGVICLTAAEAETLKKNWGEYEAAYKSEHAAEIESRRLRSEREPLVLQITGYRADAQSARNRGWESGDGTGQWVNAGDADKARADELAEELKAFDDAHPEIIAQIKAEQAKSIERNIWN